MKYRKKPIVIEAMQFDGTNFDAIYEWSNPSGSVLKAHVLLWGTGKGEDAQYLAVETPEGTVKAGVGAYIIKGVRGEFYPCRPDIFAKTYEPVGENG